MCDMIRKVDPVNGKVTLVCEECGEKIDTSELAPDPTDKWN